MSIIASEIKYFGSLLMADDDVTTPCGSGIDTSCKIEFTQMGGNNQLEVLSSSGADTTQSITVVGRKTDGSLVTEGPHVLTGGTPKALGTTVFERILKATLSSTCTGTISGRNASGGTLWFTLEPGITKMRVPFYNASADASGGVTKNYYEKIFVKNTNGTLALTSAIIAEQSDPSTYITFGLEGTLNGTGITTTRIVSASGIVLDNTSKNVATGNLTPNDTQGIWLNLSLPAGAVAQKTTYTLRTTGNSI